MRTRTLLLYGAGGHAKVAYEAARLSEPELAVEVCDDEPERQGQPFVNVRIIAVPERLAQSQFVHVAIGDNRARRDVTETLVAKGARLHTLQHSAAVVSAWASVQPGCLIAAQAIVGPEAHVGRGVIVNHAAVVDHECEVSDWCHIAPGAVLGGRVILGEGVLVGSGAVVLPGVRVGDWAVVGGGAVVTRDVMAGVTVVGVPAWAMKR